MTLLIVLLIACAIGHFSRGFFSAILLGFLVIKIYQEFEKTSNKRNNKRPKD